MEVQAGGYVAVTGVSGAGQKSTLLSILGGLERGPDGQRGWSAREDLTELRGRQPGRASGGERGRASCSRTSACLSMLTARERTSSWR